MNIFSIRRRDALIALKVPEAQFEAIKDTEGESSLPCEPEHPTAVSAANELVTALVALDIMEAVRADNPIPQKAEMLAPLSQRHLETIDRMVVHLRGDEDRLQRHIAEAKRQLADTKLARHVFERNSTDLRRGIALLSRNENSQSADPQRPRPSRASSVTVHGPQEVDGLQEGRTQRISKPRGPGKVH